MHSPVRAYVLGTFRAEPNDQDTHTSRTVGEEHALHFLRAMRCSPAISLAAVALGIPACTGSLREQLGQSEVDASGLTMIQPPPCADPAVAPDTGVCTGGGHPGDDCLMCHHQGGAAPPYTFAGTLYASLKHRVGV